MKQQEKFKSEIWQTARCKDLVNVEQISDVLAGQIKDFRFNTEESVTFTGWFSRYEDLFEKDAHKLEDDGKVRLLLRKLGLLEHERYTSYVLPSKPKDFNFAETVSKLKSLFGPRESELVEECQQIVDLKGDTVMHEGENKEVNIRKDGKRERIAQKWQHNRLEQGAQHKASIPVIKCWHCGEGHYARKCAYGCYRYKQCYKYGHKEGHCTAAERYRKSTSY
uniref:DUF7083 domain-containing protein n=1 Tax=Anopheles funestus TaxID=62324 RepID=A0A182R7Y8_ANOFN